MVEDTIPEETPQTVNPSSVGNDVAKDPDSVTTKVTSKPSVFDRLYAERPRKTRSEVDNSNAGAKEDPKVEKGAKTRGRLRKDTPNSASVSLVDKKPVDEDSESLNSSISTAASTGNVYERLYRTTTQSRKASQRNETSHGQLAAPRKTRERDLRKERNLADETNARDEFNKTSLSQADNLAEPIEPGKEEEPKRPASSSFFDRPRTALKSARLHRAIQTLNSRQAFSNTKPKKRKPSLKVHKIPVGLLERGSIVRGAIPLLPFPAAALCLVFNIVLPGVGTLISGFIVLGCGAPRFSTRPTAEHRALACLINCGVGVFQAVTILFCLVGWCWSLAWGITMINLAGQYQQLQKQAQGESNITIRAEDRRPTLINLENEVHERF